MPIGLPPLPYETDALAPHISARTIEFHYGKHHRGYVDTLDKLVENTRFSSATLVEVVREANMSSEQVIFNNAGQAWNHEFHWRSMTPNGGAAPRGAIADAINDSFGDFQGFKDAFSAEAASLFGSGWTWLIADRDKLRVASTSNADTPIRRPGLTPLLVLDVWEHAYYLDHQNERAAYIDAFLAHLANWRFAEENLGRV